MEGRKWVFRRNINTIAQVKKFKPRLVDKGYSQVKGVDFGDIFSLIVKLTSIRLLMYLATIFTLEIEKMDVKEENLHGDL